MREAQALTRRCLGELDVAELLELTLAAAPGALVLADPGFCDACPAGGAAAPPGAACRTDAASLLGAMGLAELSPILRSVNDSGYPRNDDAARRRERRGFLHRVALGEKPTTPSGRDARAARAATLAALKGLARAFGKPLPGVFFPRLVASERCRDHAVCAALCTTGALTRYERDARRGLRFDPALCTSCGECASHCPEHALSLTPCGVAAHPMGAATLTSHGLRSCERCEDDFVPVDDEWLCLGCRKDAALFMRFPQGGAR